MKILDIWNIKGIGKCKYITKIATMFIDSSKVSKWIL